MQWVTLWRAGPDSLRRRLGGALLLLSQGLQGIANDNTSTYANAKPNPHANANTILAVNCDANATDITNANNNAWWHVPQRAHPVPAALQMARGLTPDPAPPVAPFSQDGQWFNFNDALVNQSDPSALEDAFGGGARGRVWRMPLEVGLGVGSLYSSGSMPRSLYRSIHRSK